MNLSVNVFGKRIRNYRNEKNVTVKNLATQVGVTSNYLQLIESGNKIPKLETAIKILNALDLSSDAAFMDSIISGYAIRAHYLEMKMAGLTPQKQKLLLDLFEVMLIKLAEESES